MKDGGGMSNESDTHHGTAMKVVLSARISCFQQASQQVAPRTSSDGWQVV